MPLMPRFSRRDLLQFAGTVARAGTDVVEAIQQVGPRLFNLHMKDLTSFQSKESQVAVG